MHPSDSIFLARLSDKCSPKSACGGKTKRSSSLLVASFCNFFFQKEKVERSFLVRKKRGFVQFFIAKLFSLLSTDKKSSDCFIGRF